MSLNVFLYCLIYVNKVMIKKTQSSYYNMRQFVFVMDDTGVSWAIDVLG